MSERDMFLHMALIAIDKIPMYELRRLDCIVNSFVAVSEHDLSNDIAHFIMTHSSTESVLLWRVSEFPPVVCPSF